MATNKTPIRKASAEPQEQPREAASEEAQALPSPATAEAPAGPEHRSTVPSAPTGLVGGNSQITVASIRAYVQAGVYQPQEAEAAIQQIERLPVKNLHPRVAEYKAEALDYLRGKAQTPSE